MRFLYEAQNDSMSPRMNRQEPRTERRRSTLLEYNSFIFPRPSSFAAVPDDNGSQLRPNLAHTTNTAVSRPLHSGSRRQSKHQHLSAKEKKKSMENVGKPAVRDKGPDSRFALQATWVSRLWCCDVLDYLHKFIKCIKMHKCIHDWSHFPSRLYSKWPSSQSW